MEAIRQCALEGGRGGGSRAIKRSGKGKNHAVEKKLFAKKRQEEKLDRSLAGVCCLTRPGGPEGGTFCTKKSGNKTGPHREGKLIFGERKLTFPSKKRTAIARGGSNNHEGGLEKPQEEVGDIRKRGNSIPIGRLLKGGKGRIERRTVVLGKKDRTVSGKKKR